VSSFTKIQRESLSDHVYRLLHIAIVSGDLPPLERLRDQEVAARLGVSRTPVREALQRLEAEGLVETIPGSLTRVTPLDSNEARDGFPVVAVLHGLATRLAAPRLTQHDLTAMQGANEALRAAIDAGDTLGAVQADDQFHGVILQAAGNGELLAALERVMPKIRRLKFAQFSSLTSRASCAQHAEILQALTEGNARAAAALVEENWLSLGRLLVQALEHTEGGRHP
jgi:DNA-binding GntR family transcriptional regulator